MNETRRSTCIETRVQSGRNLLLDNPDISEESDSISGNTDAIPGSNIHPHRTLFNWPLRAILSHASGHIRPVQLVQVLMVLLVYSDVQSGQQCRAIPARLAVQVETRGFMHGVERVAVKPSRILYKDKRLTTHFFGNRAETSGKCYLWWPLAR